MEPEILIDAAHLYRWYGNHCAVKDVSFQLSKGEVLGFLGPNGAGKSSTMNVIAGNLAPSAGHVRINGIDLLDRPREAKAQLGYLPEQPPLYQELTVDEYLVYCARLNRVPGKQIPEALQRARARCGLDDVGHRLIGNLSKGFQQRVGIAQAILHNPAVVILDEPTVGLDPIQIREIRDLIRELGKDHGIILSTHILPEVQAVCTHVQIIHEGRLVFADSVAGLEQQLSAQCVVCGFRNAPDAAALQALPGCEQLDDLGNGRFRVRFAGEDPAERIAEQAAAQGWRLVELTPERRTLEQIFVELTCKDSPATESAA